MLKLRLQGESSEIRRFLKCLRRSKLYVLENESDILSNRNSRRFKRYYCEITLLSKRDREEKTKKANEKKDRNEMIRIIGY